jgi:hypothetical protein
MGAYQQQRQHVGCWACDLVPRSLHSHSQQQLSDAHTPNKRKAKIGCKKKKKKKIITKSRA